MSKNAAPCYDTKKHSDCPRRKPGCGQHCKKWKEYEARRNADYDAEYTKRQLDWDRSSARRRAEHLKRVQRGLKYKGGNDDE